MRVRLACAVAALTVVSGAAVASATSQPPANIPAVTVGTANGGVQFGTSLPGQPLFGGHVDRTGVCVGFSYQMPFCLPVALS
jgi:hypothetical protein